MLLRGACGLQSQALGPLDEVTSPAREPRPELARRPLRSHYEETMSWWPSSTRALARAAVAPSPLRMVELYMCLYL